MSNLFDNTNYPTTEPETLVTGDRWVWKRTDLGSDYAVGTYTLTYSCRHEGSTATEIEITASESGSDYIVEVASATTAGYTVGTYRWQAYITRDSDSERVTINNGYFEVKPDNDSDTTDQTSHAKKTLVLIEAAVEALNFGASSYAIAGRSFTRTDMTELMDMRDRYRAEVNREERKASGKGGNKLVYRL